MSESNGSARRVITSQELVDFFVRCRRTPDEKLLRLVQTRLPDEVGEIPLEALAASITAPAGQEPPDAPPEVVEPAFHSVFEHPEHGLGDLARAHFDVDELVLPDQEIHVLYLKANELEISARGRLRGAFRRVDGDFDRYFLDTVRDNWIQAERDLSRSIVLSLALFAVFELVNRAAISSADIFGLKIEDFSLPLIFMPPVIAYLFLRTVISWKALTVYHEAYDAGLAELHPDLYNRDLETYVGASLTSLWDAPKFFLLVNSTGRSQTVFNWLSSVIAALAVLSSIVIVLYLYWQLIARLDEFHIALIPSLAASVILAVMGLTFMFGSTGDIDYVELKDRSAVS